MAAYPPKYLAFFFAFHELGRYVFAGMREDWVAWLLRRLADRQLSGQRRWTIAAVLVSAAKSRASASLARDVWLAGRDLWSDARKPTVAVLACEAAAWLRDQPTFDDALAVCSRLLTDSARARLEFLREVYLQELVTGVPRLIRLPVPLAHDGHLHYVDDYARARAADSRGKLDVAEEYYMRALTTLPRDHEAYRFAMSRCNTIRNMAVGDPGGM